LHIGGFLVAAENKNAALQCRTQYCAPLSHKTKVDHVHKQTAHALFVGQNRKNKYLFGDKYLFFYSAEPTACAI
jgi:hypothetical protein